MQGRGSLLNAQELVGSKNRRSALYKALHMSYTVAGFLTARWEVDLDRGTANTLARFGGVNRRLALRGLGGAWGNCGAFARVESAWCLARRLKVELW